MTKKKDGSSSTSKTIRWAIWLLIFIIFLVWIASCVRSCRNERPENNKDTVGVTYKFADYPNGKVPIYIDKTTTRYPIGGKVMCQTPSGKIITIEPGKIVTRDPEPPGEFIFWAGDSSASGIIIKE
jgi:hypothetical protein